MGWALKEKIGVNRESIQRSIAVVAACAVMLPLGCKSEPGSIGP